MALSRRQIYLEVFEIWKYTALWKLICVSLVHDMLVLIVQ